MKKFLRDITLFSLILLLLAGLLFLIPATPMQKLAFLAALPQKDSMLIHTESPRIIFVGGSGTAFGLDCTIIKDSLKLNPVNTGLLGGLGLPFVMKRTLKYLKEGDVVIISPEYGYFYGQTSFGDIVLLKLVSDHIISPFELSCKQYKALIKHAPICLLAKINPFQYINPPNPVYSVHAFNEYGDACLHWNLGKLTTFYITPIDSNSDIDILKEMEIFSLQAQAKGAKVYVAFTGIQDSTYHATKDHIEKIYSTLKDHKFQLLGTPERYVFADSLIYDDVVHLTKKGAEIRTKLLIEDYKKMQQESP